MDFIEGLPLFDGRSVILTVVGRFMKFNNFFSLTHPYTIVGVVKVFFDGVFKLHGLPKIIVLDQDPIFTSSFWQQLFLWQGTQLALTSTYHPQTNG